MKNLKVMMVMLFALITTFSFGQERVEKHTNDILNLKTLDFEVIKSTSDTYYKHVIYSGYKYPTIREGFYSQSIFVRGDELIDFYQELIRISVMEDGIYKLSKKYGSVSKVKKTQNKIKMYYTAYYNSKPVESVASGFVGKAKIKFLKEDLKTIENYINN